VSVVTGSTGGIGEGIARRLAADGFAVVVSGRRAAKGEDIARQITDQGGTTCFLAADIDEPDACRSVIEAAVELKMEILVK